VRITHSRSLLVSIVAVFTSFITTIPLACVDLWDRRVAAELASRPGAPLLLFILSRRDVQIFVLRQDAGRRPTHRDEGVDAHPLVLEDLRELA
jgi:hypothetical protein